MGAGTYGADAVTRTPRTASAILDALGPVDCGDGMTQESRVIRRGCTITTRVNHGHLARVLMARRTIGLPEWPLVPLRSRRYR